MMKISEEEYKLAKEAHVSNCTGGNIHEISTVCGSLVSSHLLWASLVQTNSVSQDKFLPQFVIYVLPVLLNMTLASDYAYAVTIGMATVAMAIFLTGRVTETKETKPANDNYKPFLTVYRAGTMISTCIAILAVDFQFFPRRFAKVETFGTSLMDVGVGSFVFSSGIVASRAYLDPVQKRFTTTMLQSMRTALPILVLGFARFFLTKSVNYQEHNSEYGLHWNFFFTLGFLPPFVTAFAYTQQFALFGAMIAGVYQFVLCQGLQEWVLNAPRVDLLSANKEGICSFAGYLSIFLFGLQVGVWIFSSKPMKLILFSGIMWGALAAWTWFFPDYYVSRRMANLPYVVWVIAFNVSLLTLLILVDDYAKPRGRGPPMLDAMNMNGLFTFLLANVLTGTINLTMYTLYASDLISLVVNVVYMFIVCLIPWIFWQHYHLRIKF
ncbi:GWT1-domain-containing protein [Gilbertella persicaria]|uniref:GPI-anchored wall transfer protein n=1 Tax=Rhizopus stolonifer TaxID=4846 RepID=A0A367KYF0_RHIST|nr:GWT1-domain-containing protein [Gilbertella persicaria]KAI8073389.1 GWT1-domain-containing protein [Gilbertella persicaria]RCI06912.1 Glucosaminyl phosphatidylinositol (GlcN-PI) nositol acylation protein [Rhizopus stolonifer]